MFKPSDKYIIEGLLEGDYHILKKIYLDFYPGVFNYIISQSGSEADARDVFQDAMVVIYIKARKNPDFLTSTFKTFLFSTCRIQWLSMLNSRHRNFYPIDRVEDGIESDEKDIIEDLIEMEKRKLVLKHFNTLNEECRRILELAIDGIPLDSIKKIMGYSSVQYVKNRRLNCKNILVRKVRNSPEFKELCNEKIRENTEIPRW